MTDTRRLIIVPQGGLANRMRAIASAVVVAGRLNRPLTVVWHRNFELDAPFEILFQTDGLPFELAEPGSLKYHFYYEEPRKRNLFLSRFFVWLAGNAFERDLQLLSEDEVIARLASRKSDIVINSGYQFAGLGSDFFSSLFRFSKEVETAKRDMLKGKKPQASLQIRRTDNANSIRQSPLECFEEVIEKHIAENPEFLFFLATDDNETKSILSSRYSGHIVFNPREARRDTPEGLVDAAAEFLIMAESPIIYGSYWSSYSEIASLYGDTRLVVVRR